MVSKRIHWLLYELENNKGYGRQIYNIKITRVIKKVIRENSIIKNSAIIKIIVIRDWIY